MKKLKQHYKAGRSRWLLLAVCTWLAGLTSATAQGYTCGFETADGWASVSSPGDGWTIVGGAGDLTLSSNTNYRHSGSYGLYWSDTGANTSHYVVSPKLAAGTVTFYARGRNNSSGGSVKVYVATENGDSYTIGTDNLCSNCNESIGDLSHSSWKQFTFTLTADAHVAFLLYKTAIDDISAPAGLAAAATQGMQVKDGTATIASPFAYDFGLTTAGATKTFTLKNLDTANPLSVTAPASSFSSAVSATIAAGGTYDLTFTMPAASVAAEAVTVTPAAGDAFTFNLSGTVKDPSKFFFDFSDADNSFPATWTVDEAWVLSEDGYLANTGDGEAAIVSSRIKTATAGEKIFLKHYGTVYDGGTLQYSYIKVYTSADAANWTQAGNTIATEQAWGVSSVDIPATARYIKITGRKVRIDDFYGLEADNAASFATLLFTTDDYDFGIVTANRTTTPYTISNTGTAELNGLQVTVDGSSAFTVNVDGNATKIAANGGTATFTVTMSAETPGVHTATIRITSDNGGEASFLVSGVVMKDGMATVDFNDNQLPARWTQGTTAWTFAEGAAKGIMLNKVYATMTTPKLQFADGDFLVVKAKRSLDDTGSLLIEGSADGTDFTAYSKEIALTAEYVAYAATGIPATVKYIRLTGKYALLDEIIGLNYAPELVVTKDGKTVTSGTTYDFGDLNANQTVTYRMANAASEGTISITGVSCDNSVFTTNWTAATAVPFDLVVTANYNAANEGAQTGKVTVTTTDGTFDINVTTNILPASQPKMAFFLGDDVTESATGAKISFGMTESSTKTITIKNEGTGALTITAITVPAGFTLKQGTTAVGTSLTVAANSTAALTLAMDGAGAHSGTLSFKADGFDTFTFALDGYVIDNSKMLVDFNDNQQPAGWKNSGFTFADGAAKAATSGGTNSTLTSPALLIADGDQLALSIKKGEGNTQPELYYHTSADGEQWAKSANVAAELTTDYTVLYIGHLPATAKYLKLEAYNVVIDCMNGLMLNNNAPAFGVFSSADFSEENKTDKAQNIDFSFTDGSAKSFFLTNTGTGTLVLAKPVAEEPVLAVVSDTKNATLNAAGYEIAAGGYVKLNISLPTTAAAGVYTGKTVTMAAKDTELGAFTATVSGVVADAAKMNLDFTQAATVIPSDWTAGNWGRSGDNQYISVSGYATSNELTTTPLIAQAGEPVVLVAKTKYNGSLAVNYRAEDAEEWSVLRAAAATAGDGFETIVLTMPSDVVSTKRYLLQLVATNDAQIQRIYGLTEPMEPKMEVTDGTEVLAGTDNSYDFGSQTAAAEKVYTIANPGKSALTGLTAVLSGDGAADYSVVLSASEVAAKGEPATVTVTQKFDAASLGSHSAMLTISADGMTPVVIALSGKTRDGSKMYIDFSDAAWPEHWTQSGWTISSGQAYRSSNEPTAIITAPLQVKQGETLLLDAGRYSTVSSYIPTLKVRYTKDGGLTWSDYQDFSSKIAAQTTTELTTCELTGIAADADALAVLEITGAALRLDNIYGGQATTAPMLAVTADGEAVANGTSVDFGNLTADATAVYTLTNNGSADLVSTVTANVVTAEISGDDVTIDGNKVTVPAGKQATVTVKQSFAAPYGNKNGQLTITSDGWVGDFTINFAAVLVDPTTLYVNFDEGSKPAGWFSDNWTFANGYAQAPNTGVTALITEQYEATADKQTPSFEAWQTTTSQFVNKQLTVYTSEDRLTWSEGQQLTLTAERQTVTLPALTTGKKYYVKFEGQYVAVDNFTGLAKIMPAPEHDLYMAAATLPTETTATPGRMIPGAEYTAKVKVASLRAEETVKAELYFNNEKKAELAADATIAADETAELTLTAAVSETEGTYDVYVRVYNDKVAATSGTVQVVAEHTRTLAITGFSRVMAQGEPETLEANGQNQVTATFEVTVQNTGSTAATPVVKVMNNGSVIGTATAAEAVAAGATQAVKVVAENFSAGEGGALTFTTAAYWDAQATDAFDYTTNVPLTISVVAAAPKFVLAEGTTVMNDGDAVSYGIQKSATKKTLTITNEGNKALEMVSITAPEGYEVTALTADNKTVAVGTVLNIDVTLKAGQGKREGNLVFRYKVDDNTEKTFTLAVSGRSVSADTWVEDFEGSQPLATWTGNWNVNESDTYGKTLYYSNTFSEGAIYTPRLKAAAGETFCYDLKQGSVKVEYSTDKEQWTTYATASTIGENTVTFAEAMDGVYLRFTTNLARIDNLVGFQLSPLEHDVAVTSLTLPAAMNQYAWYDIKVDLQEMAGKQEKVTATLYWNGAPEDGIADSERSKMTTTLQPNGSGTIAFSFQPQWSAENAIPMYLVLAFGDAAKPMTVQTETVNVVSAVAPVISETDQTEEEIATFTDKAVMWEHQWQKGWNTMCVPFAFENTQYAFGNDHFYEFTGYDEATNIISFRTVTNLKASRPYIFYTTSSDGSIRTIIQGVSVNYGLATPDKVTYNGVSFQGTYARMDAGTLADKWLVEEADGRAGAVKGTADKSQKAFSAYFTGIPETLDGQTLRIQLDDEVLTGIEALKLAEQLGVRTYNLNGQRVVNPKKGGLYIVNGKQVVVK